MFTTHRRAVAPALAAAALLLAGPLLTACSGDSSAASSDSSSSADSQFDRALAYSQCMRDNGVPDFPDPQQQGGGIQLGGNSIDPNSPQFQSAQEACRDKAPIGQGDSNGAPLDAAKVADWAQCIRDHGVPKFPDPEINGSNMALNFAGTGVNPQDEAFGKARDACQDKWPGGGMMITGVDGGQ